jgi:hypothetical protein
LPVNEKVEILHDVRFQKNVVGAEADMFFSFDYIDDLDAKFKGTVTANADGTSTFKGTIYWHIQDRYEFQNRPDFHPFPGSTTSDHDFWLLQQHGLAKGFNVVGNWTENTTFTIPVKRIAAPGRSGYGGY